MKRLRVYFEHSDTLCIEFVGSYDAGAYWYSGFMARVRQELGAKNPRDHASWGKVGNAHKLLLASGSLRQPVTLREAREAVERAVAAYNGYPHDKHIELEVAEYA